MAASIEGRESLQDLEAVVARVMQRAGPVRLSGLRGAARAVVTAALARAHGERPVLVLVPSAKAADAFLDDLRAALGEPPEGGRVRGFPRHDTHPYERFSPQPFLVAQRMDVLYRWLASARAGAPQAEPAPIVVAQLERARACACPRALRCARAASISRSGRRSTATRWSQTLVAAGYARMPIVEERGELAVRGGMLDLFPPQRSRPVRVELLGNEVESIREFDAASQRSQQPLPGGRRRRRRARSCSTARS